MKSMTVMIPTLVKESHDRKAARNPRATALKEMLKARKKGPSRPPAKTGVKEVRRAKEKLTSVQRPMMRLKLPQWLKVEHGKNRQKTYIRNIGTRKVPIAGTPRME